MTRRQLRSVRIEIWTVAEQLTEQKRLKERRGGNRRAYGTGWKAHRGESRGSRVVRITDRHMLTAS